MLFDLGVGHGDSRCRDVFPIPLLSVPVVANPNLSRSVRQRIKQDIASTKRANEAIDVLNDLFCSHEDLVNHGSNSSICSDHIKQCVQEYSPVDTVVPEEALSSLLGESHSYTEDVASSTLVSFQPGQQSLPAVSSLPPDMRRILDKRASHTLESFEKEMMLDQTAFSELIAREGRIKPYIDPKLSSSREGYEAFITELSSLHIVTHTQAPREHVGLFFVKRKDHLQRVIIDCRSTNQHFKKSPNMPIGGAAAWSSIRLPPGAPLYCAQYDVQAFFYRCGITADLGRFFCLPSISHELARRLWPGQVFQEDLPVYPCMSVLPMGFSWSFWLGQRAHVHLSLEASGLSGAQIFVEGRPSPNVVDEVALMPYCDNGNIISTDPVAVIKIRDKIIQRLEAEGFDVHEITDAETKFDSLGVRIDGCKHSVTSTSKRLSRILCVLDFVVYTTLHRRASARARSRAHHFLLYFAASVSCLAWSSLQVHSSALCSPQTPVAIGRAGTLAP